MLPAGSHAGRRNLASIRVSTAHTCRTCRLCPLCVWAGVHWAGLLLAGDWPSLCPAPTPLLLLGPAQPSTLTLTKPFQKTLKTRYLHMEFHISICTDIFAHIYCNARPLSPLQQGVCPRLLRMRRSRVRRAQAPAPGRDMPMSAETELDCLVTTSRGHVPGHVTCRGSRYAHYDYDGVRGYSYTLHAVTRGQCPVVYVMYI